VPEVTWVRVPPAPPAVKPTGTPADQDSSPPSVFCTRSTVIVGVALQDPNRKGFMGSYSFRLLAGNSASSAGETVGVVSARAKEDQ
jgi:hypothetical protein